MKNLILAIVLVFTALTGCEKNEEDMMQINKEQISTAHFKALGALQALPGYLGTSGENATNANGEFITTFINLSKDWKPGEESNLSNQVAVLMLKSDELNFNGWDESDLTYTGIFVYKNVKENKSTIEIIFRLDPYISFSLNTYIR